MKLQTVIALLLANTQALKLKHHQSPTMFGQLRGSVTYVGCFKDEGEGVNGTATSNPPGPRKLGAFLGNMSAGECFTKAAAQGHKLAGLQYGSECWAGSQMLTTDWLPEAECGMPCS